MSEISSFRFWCQKVLPAVYDDSLSYYELLCKVVAKLNEVINSQNGTNDHVTELAQQFEQLKNDLQGTIESEAEKIVDNYVKTNNLVKSVNGITAVGETGNVTLQASDVGAIANVTGSVKGSNIEAGAVTADKIATGAVGSEKIAQDAVTASKLANGSVAADKIQAGAVNWTKLADGSVTSIKIAEGAVSKAKIAQGAVTADKLSNDAVPVKSVNAKTGEVVLSAEDVGAIAAEDGAVKRGYIANDSITANKLARPGSFIANAFVKTTISDTTGFTYLTNISGEDIEDSTITADKMANQGAENTGKLLKIGADGQPAWLSGEGTVTAGVESVNGKDGVVTLTAQDVEAIANGLGTVKGKNLDIRADSASIAAIREITKTPTGVITLSWPGGIQIKILADDRVVGEAYAVANVGPFSFAGMRIDGGEDKCRITGLTDGKTIVGNADGSFHYQAIPLSVNGKTGIVVLSADDIEGALQEVAPSDVLTGENVIGAYLFLAPANGATDAFQKVDKLPGNMLPTDIDGSLLKDGTVGSGKLIGLSVTTEKINNGAVTGAKMATNSVSTACVQDGAVTLAKLNQPGAAESGKVLGVSSTGQWELQTPSSTGDWEEIPATSLIEGATVHCRIQPGTGWLWFSITSNDGTQIKLANAKSGSASAATTNWGTINVNVCNKPVPPNGSSASSDSYPGAKNTVSITGVATATINDTSVSKLNTQSTTSLTPSLTIKRNNTGVTLFGVSSTSSTAINGVHGDFFIQYWFDNRTTDGSEAYPSV